jgi:hypothetical protein
VAKDQASQVAGSAGDAAQHVAEVAKDQLGQVAGKAARQKHADGPLGGDESAGLL